MGKFRQFQTAIACSIGSMIMGMLNVWPSYTLSLYTAHNTTLLSAPMTEFEKSLLGSLPSLGAMVGTAVVGLVIEFIGRKKSGLAFSLPFVVSWAIIEVSSSTMPILIARFLAGIAGGAFLVYAPIYISEISEDSIRGMLASGPIMFYCLGALISYLLGWFCTYHSILWINLFNSVACALLFMFVIESPVYLLKQNKEEEASESIAKYRGLSSSSKVVLEEISRLKQKILPAVELVPVGSDIEEKVEEAEREKLNKENESPEAPIKMAPIKLLFMSPSSRRAFTVVGIVISMQVFMGIVPVQVYAKDLFSEAAPNLSSHFCSVLFALILLSGSLITAAVADKAGRRILIITSSVMVGLCMTCLGFLLQTKIAPPLLTALALLVYCFSFNFGSGTVPYVLLAESFVSEVQGLASTLLVEWVWFLNFFIIAVFPYLSKLLGVYGVFYIFACFGVINAIISYFIVPETKGLSNERIQEAYLRRRKK